MRPENQLVYGISSFKEPDLLVYSGGTLTDEERRILTTEEITSASREEFMPGRRLNFAFSKAISAIEVEFSPYRAAEMKDRNWVPRTAERWSRRPLKNATTPTAPNIWVKERDLSKLIEWERTAGVPIVVVHLFDQEAFAISLGRIAEFNVEYENNPEQQTMLQVTSGIFKNLQNYDRVDAQGAGEKKMVFRIVPAVAVRVGDVLDVTVSAQLGVSSSKKYVTLAVFSGGRVEFTQEFLDLLSHLRS